MSIEESIRNAYYESYDKFRTGDTLSEVETIRECIRSAKSITIPNWNDEKFTVVNEVLKEFGLCKATHLQFPTNCCDLTRIPVLSKALMALDISNGDLVIARGRLGVPGSGSMLIIMDKKGRILSAALSPPHVLHQKSLPDAVRDELSSAL